MILISLDKLAANNKLRATSLQPGACGIQPKLKICFKT